MMTFINYMMTYNKYTTNHIYNVHSAPQTLSFPTRVNRLCAGLFVLAM